MGFDAGDQIRGDTVSHGTEGISEGFQLSDVNVFRIDGNLHNLFIAVHIA